MPLSARGRAEARAAQPAVRRFAPDFVIRSDFARAIETADLAIAGTDLKAETADVEIARADLDQRHLLERHQRQGRQADAGHELGADTATQFPAEPRGNACTARGQPIDARSERAAQQDPRAYLPVVLTRYEGVELMNYSPFIYAFEQKNIAITGEGVLDGNANCEHWWPWAGRQACGWKQGDGSARTDHTSRGESDAHPVRCTDQR